MRWTLQNGHAQILPIVWNPHSLTLPQKGATKAEKLKRYAGEDMQLKLADIAAGGLPAGRDHYIKEEDETVAPLAKVRRDEFSQVLTSVPTTTYAARVEPARVDSLVSGQLGKHAATWKSTHVGVMHSPLPPLISKAQRRICQEAERCVCKGDGRVALRFAVKLQACFGDSAKKIGTKAFGEMTQDAKLVCRLQWQDSLVVYRRST